MIGVSATAQQPPSSEAQPYSLEATSFIDALLKISAYFQIPMGVEWVKSADTLNPVQILRSHTTVKDVVDAVVSNYAGYDWRMEDGVIHVFQRYMVNDTRNPLNITVETFEVKNTVTWANVVLFHKIQHIVRTPDLRGIAGSIASSPDDPVFSFAAQNAPARSILNRMVTAGLNPSSKPVMTAEAFETAPGAKRVWIATFPETPAFSRTGYLDVVSIEDSKFMPNESQPFWILLAWGETSLPRMEK
jgi:hypothetical protein